MQELTLAKTAAWLKECEDAYILIHRSPDGDCIGAGYALARCCTSWASVPWCCAMTRPEAISVYACRKETAQRAF